VLLRQRDRAVALPHLEVELRLDFKLSQLALFLDLGDARLLLALDPRGVGGDGRLLARARRVGVARGLELFDLEPLADLRFLFLAGG
jgi:hypothetical protein